MTDFLKPPRTLKDSGSAGAGLDVKVAEYVTMLMAAATAVHQMHLQITGPGSFAGHLALNDLYDALPDLADTIAEGYQGAAETLLSYATISTPSFKSVTDVLSFTRTAIATTTKLQAEMPYSEIVNDLDTVKAMLNKTKYKLLFLK